MSLFDKLVINKGTVSSTLGKEIAQEILEGNLELLKEAIPLVCYKLDNKKEKNVRAGAAKIVEIIAEKEPKIISKYLDKLLPALESDEPQTRWMIIRTIGFCSSINPKIAQKAIPYAKKYINEKVDGQLCLVGATDMFLGDYGSISNETSQEVFPILINSTNNVIQNEHDWIMEAFIKIGVYLTRKQKDLVIDFINEFKDNSRKATQVRIKKILEIYK